MLTCYKNTRRIIFILYIPKYNINNNEFDFVYFRIMVTVMIITYIVNKRIIIVKIIRYLPLINKLQIYYINSKSLLKLWSGISSISRLITYVTAWIRNQCRVYKPKHGTRILHTMFSVLPLAQRKFLYFLWGEYLQCRKHFCWCYLNLCFISLLHDRKLQIEGGIFKWIFSFRL